MISHSYFLQTSRFVRQASIVSFLGMALVVTSCKKESHKSSDVVAEMTEITSIDDLMKRKPRNKDEEAVTTGIKAIADGNLVLASRTFNTLLIDAPLDAYLHTLNALTYQLMAQQGEVSKLTLAQAGFEQALKIDPDMTIASLQLGRIYSTKKDYVKAQEQFSDVLIRDSDNTDAYYELAKASYHLGDLKTAVMSVDQAITRNANKPEYVRAAAMIYAALGKAEQAELYNARYATLDVSARQKKHLDRRVHDWLELYSSGRFYAQADTEGAAAGGSGPASTSASASTPESAATTSVASPSAPPAMDPVNSADSAAPMPATMPTPAPKAAQEPEHIRQHMWEELREDMVVIDAILMRVSDIGITQKGNNIMENLKMILVPGNFFKARGVPNTVNVYDNNNNNFLGTNPAPGFGGSTVTMGAFSATSPAGLSPTNNTATLITQGLSFSTVEYSLNIANSRDQYAEVIARPTLTATVGEQARFSSGRNRKIAVNGQFGGNVTETPIGTSLDVKVREFKDGFVTLEIEIIGSSFEQGDSLPSDQSDNRDNGTVFTLNEDKIKTVVKVREGESIMLGGITQRELKTSKDGVPILQSIPLIQYFFSRELSESDYRSIMIILTPRSYKKTISETKTYFARGQEFGKRPKLTEFEKRHKDWYDPGVNTILILEHLDNLYHEVRTNDLDSIKWGHTDNVHQQLVSISNFIYF